MEIVKKIQKTISIIAIVMIIVNLAVPNYSQAIDSKLGEPFQVFGCFIGDSIMNCLQNFFLGEKAIESDGKKNSQDTLNIKYSVANIVSNKVPILDINFFTGGEDLIVTDNTKLSQADELKNKLSDTKTKAMKLLNEWNSFSREEREDIDKINEWEAAWRAAWEDNGFANQWWSSEASEGVKKIWENNGNIKYENSVFYDMVEMYQNDYRTLLYNDDLYKKYFIYTDEDGIGYFIQTWEYGFNDAISKVEAYKASLTTVKDSSANILSTTVKKWYYAFRNLSLVALLSILLYIGIKIVLSSAAEDKAKYKKLLTNWFVAIALVFSLHFIMAFTLTLVDEINDLLSENIVSSDGKDTLMEKIRTKAANKNIDGEDKMGYTILYLVLIVYVVKFSWVYIKRVIHLTFLTIISPLIAITYPIDKENDGTAQAFNMWTKEYFSNALIQPIHLLLYFVLVSTATELVEDNWIYAIVVIGFMSNAEKLLRKMFNLEKGGDASSLSSFTSGAITSGILSTLSGNAKISKPKGSGASNAGGTEEIDSSGIRLANLDDVFEGDSSGLNSGAPSSGGVNIGINPMAPQSGNSGSSNPIVRRTFRGVFGNSNMEPNMNLASPQGGNQGNINLSGIGANSRRVNVRRENWNNAARGRWSLSGVSTGNASGINLTVNRANNQNTQNIQNPQNPQDRQTSQNAQNQTTSTPNTYSMNSERNNNRAGKPRVINGVKAVVVNGAGKVFTKENVKTTIKTVANVTGGVAGGILGAAVGISSGEGLSKVAQNMATGAAAGAGLVNGVTEAGENIVGTVVGGAKNVEETFKKGYYGDDKTYQDKVLIPKLKEKNSKDSKIKEKYKNAGFDDWKAAMRSQTRDNLYKIGMVDEDKIIKAIKVKDKFNLSEEEIVQNVVVASQISSYKDAQTMSKELKAKLQESGMDEQRAESEVKRRMKHIKAIAGL